MERPSAEELRRLYQEMTLQEISAVKGWGVRTIRRWLHTYQIPLRDGRAAACARAARERAGPFPCSDEALARLYQRDKLSTNEIASLLECSEGRVSDRLRIIGVKLRTLSEACHVWLQRGRLNLSGLRSLPEDQRRENLGRAVEAWKAKAASDPEYARRNLRRANAARHRGRWVPCSWCSLKVYRGKSKQAKHIACCRSHFGMSNTWDRYHPDEPRPLILARLRELAGDERNPDRLRRMAEEIGAGDIEIAEILFPSEEER